MISAPIPSCCSPMTTSGADRRAFAQMLRKLLSNAAKFSPAGTAIEVSIGSLRNGSLQLSVADIGIGMTPRRSCTGGSAIRPDRRRAARPYEGPGLGLTIVSRLISRHGRRLTIASAPHKGTKVSLDFPVPAPRGRSEILAKDVFLTDLGVAPA
jgi:signal transduction histidine kinase